MQQQNITKVNWLPYVIGRKVQDHTESKFCQQVYPFILEENLWENTYMYFRNI